MIDIKINGIRCLLRTMGIAVKQNKLLLTRFKKKDYWFLPGGRE